MSIWSITFKNPIRALHYSLYSSISIVTCGDFAKDLVSDMVRMALPDTTNRLDVSATIERVLRNQSPCAIFGEHKAFAAIISSLIKRGGSVTIETIAWKTIINTDEYYIINDSISELVNKTIRDKDTGTYSVQLQKHANKITKRTGVLPESTTHHLLMLAKYCPSLTITLKGPNDEIEVIDVTKLRENIVKECKQIKK